MANVKFSEFPSAATVGATDIIPIVQGGVNKKATALIFSNYIGSAFVGLTGNQTVAGIKTFSSQLISTVAIGTAPFSVISTTKVTNLNADLLDGLSSAAFQTVLTNPITGTGTTNYLPKFTGASALGNSLVSDNGTRVTIDGDFRVALADANLNLQGTSKSYLLQVVDSDNRLRIYDNTANAERFSITSAGNVGIGTTSPYQAKLDVNGINGVANIGASNSNVDQLLIGSIDRASAPAFFSLPNGSAFIGAIGNGVANTLGIGTFGAAPVIFGTSNTEKMRIASGGNVLIGTTTDAGYLLDVNGTARVSGMTSIGSYFSMTSDSSNMGALGFNRNAVTGAIYNSSYSAYQLQNVNGDMLLSAFNSAGVYQGNYLTIASTGAATFSSSVTAGTGIALNNATAPASGIEFPATQVASASANNLDDYEEGTWTMGVSFGNASVGITYSNNTGSYTKIGKQVTITGYVSMTNKGSSTGIAKITGLPFTIGSSTSNYSSVSLRFDNITFASQFQGYGAVNTNNINLEDISILGTISAISDANFANNSEVLLSLTYFV